jgi:chromosome segregation ATPase
MKNSSEELAQALAEQGVKLDHAIRHAADCQEKATIMRDTTNAEIAALKDKYSKHLDVHNADIVRLTQALAETSAKLDHATHYTSEPKGEADLARAQAVLEEEYAKQLDTYKAKVEELTEALAKQNVKLDHAVRHAADCEEEATVTQDTTDAEIAKAEALLKDEHSKHLRTCEAKIKELTQSLAETTERLDHAGGYASECKEEADIARAQAALAEEYVKQLDTYKQKVEELTRALAEQGVKLDHTVHHAADCEEKATITRVEVAKAEAALNDEHAKHLHACEAKTEELTQALAEQGKKLERAILDAAGWKQRAESGHDEGGALEYLNLQAEYDKATQEYLSLREEYERATQQLGEMKRNQDTFNKATDAWETRVKGIQADFNKLMKSALDKQANEHNEALNALKETQKVELEELKTSHENDMVIIYFFNNWTC